MEHKRFLARAAVSGIVGVMLALGVLGAGAADPPKVLMVLSHKAKDKTVELKIHDKSGSQSVIPAIPDQPRWRVLPGPKIKSSKRPASRIIELYSGPERSRSLLCRVLLRYYPAKDGAWLASFQLQEEPLVYWDGRQWKPISAGVGTPAVVVLTSSTLPNAEGFYPELEFALSTGTIGITAYNVN